MTVRKRNRVSCETLLKKVSSVLLSAVLMCTVLVSCGRVEYTDEDVIAAVEELLPLSFKLNDIYFGEGLPISDDRADVERFYASFSSDVESVNYHPVAKDCEYQSEADIREATEKVFSAAYCEYLFELAFTGISAVFDEGTEKQLTQNASYARYIQNGDTLTVRLDIIYEAMDLSREYDVNRMEIVTKKPGYAVVVVPTEKNGEALDVELKLVCTEDGFRLDSPTY